MLETIRGIATAPARAGESDVALHLTQDMGLRLLQPSNGRWTRPPAP